MIHLSRCSLFQCLFQFLVVVMLFGYTSTENGIDSTSPMASPHSSSSTNTNSTDCKPLNHGNGHISPKDDVKNGTKVTLNCTTGYSLFGANATVCSNGTWLDELGTCIKDCKPLNHRNGDISPKDDVKNGTKVTLNCTTGYSLFGANATVCSNGTWLDELGTCIKECKPLNHGNGDISPKDDVKNGTKVTLNCTTGYSLFGANATVCSNGTWLDELGTCIKDCEPLNHETSDISPKDNVRNGISVTLNCTIGYSLFGEKSTVCNSGTWSHQLGKWLKDCKPLNHGNGDISPKDDVKNGTKVTLNCTTGYSLFGANATVCSNGTWLDELGTCIKDCKPLNHGNGDISPKDDVKNGTKVTLNCTRGYSLFGANATVCSNGTWLDELGTCIKDCEPLNHENGDISPKDDVKNGTRVTLNCIRGYSLFGANETVCSNGTWLDELGTCIKDCEPLSHDNGDISPKNDVKNGIRVTFNCTMGYSLFGENATVCNSGTWSHQLGKCMKDCEPLNHENGDLSPKDDVKNGIKVTLNCTRGYSLFGANATVCSNGTWLDELGTCIKDCEPLNHENGDISPKDDVKNGTIVTLNCIRGYSLFGANATVCSNGTWLDELGTCIKDCEPLNHENGDISPKDDVKNGTRVTLNCIRGYSLFGANETVCSNGTWLDELGTCIKDCEPLSHDNGDISPKNDVKNGIRVTFNCTMGYSLFGENATVCYSGTWSHQLGKCMKDCEPLNHENGDLSPKDDVKNGIKVTLNCTRGYSLFGANATVCSNGTWLDELGTCIKDCEPLNHENGDISPKDDVKNGTIVTLNCIRGYSLFGANATVCSNGTWLDELGTCIKDCEPLSHDNGDISPKNDVKNGIRVTFNCTMGYSLFGENATVCNSGTWSHQLGKCMKDCEPLRHDNGDISPKDDVKNGARVTLNCSIGYSLFGANATVCSNGTWSIKLGTCIKDPEKPDNCTTSKQSSDLVELSWIPSNDNETDYSVSDGSRIISCIQNQQKYEGSCDVEGLSSNTEYTFTITSIKRYRCNMASTCNVTSKPCKVCTRTAPAPPVNITFTNITNTSFMVSWNSADARPTNISYAVKLSGDQNCSTTNISKTFYEFRKLTSGTLYIVTITAWFDGDTCGIRQRLHSESSIYSQYTKPTPVQGVSMIAASVSSVTLRINVSDDRFDSLVLNMPNTMSNFSKADFSNYTRNVLCTGLQAMTVYKVAVYTRVGNISSSPYTTQVNTAPTTPSASVIRVDRTSVTLNLYVEVGQNPHLEYFYLLPGRNTSIIIRTDINMTSVEFTIGNLSAGTKYNVSIYSSLRGWSSERPWIKEFFTVPSKVIDVTAQPVNSTALTISWSKGNGSYEYFTVHYTDCHNPDNDLYAVKEDKTKEPTIMKSGLLPGTFCNVSVTTHAGNQTSGPRFITRPSSTFETAPLQVTGLRIDMVFNKSDTLAASWNPPETKNGIIRAYIVMVYEKQRCVSKYFVNCTDCKEADNKECEKTTQRTKQLTNTDECRLYNDTFTASRDNLSLNIHSLQPYTQYNVFVSAVTSCEGPTESAGNTTDQDEPEAPGAPTVEDKASDSLNLTWAKPVPNGIINEYKIIYEYYERVCRGRGNKTSEHITISEQDSSNNITYHLKNLYPYWNYTITVQASTIKGYGPKSKAATYATGESEPSVVNMSEITTSPGAYKIDITWKPPCFSNGDNLYYNITWCNINRASDRWTHVSQSTQMMITTVLPYRNYSFQIAAVNNRFQGNYTDGYMVQSKIAEPFPPNGIKAQALSPRNVSVTWDVLRDDQYTGPTSYTARANDTFNTSLVYSCHVAGFNATSCVINGLDQYWNYAVDVTAYTRDSNTSFERKSVLVRKVTTDQDEPGSVANISLSPQTDVRLVRSVVVSWQQPRVRDLNGIITKYRIDYRVVGDNYTRKEVGNDTFKLNLTDNIKPGRVNVKVFASTSVGYGPSRSETADIMPGAVIKPNETIQQLVQKASGSVSNDERQVAVMLQLKDFLCNDINGIPKDWGVIVSGDKYATDKPYFGTYNEYMARLKEYKRWSDIKDSDKVLPYRATDKTWRPCHYSGNRRRRSADERVATSLRFVVGEDGECKNVQPNGYCNGELNPGTSYRVKTFVCTDGGCTESEYSQPLRTAPDVTVPVVAGVLSGIAVVAAILVVVFLKRREKICFEKHVEEPIFEPEIELKGTTKFRPVTVKLADFPAYVDALHKDSGLLFSDGFRDYSYGGYSNKTQMTMESELQHIKFKVVQVDHSRVKLLPLDDEEGSDFINANFIPGYTSRREYIATQGPMPATKEDFWRMVWEQNVDTIVMLTRCVEKGKRKCDEYWPEVVQEPVYSGDLILNVQSESTLSDYVIRIIEIKLKSQTRTVRQLSFLKWPDMGSPDDSTMLLEFVKTVRQFIPPGSSSPMIVHCSAGVGRTGTFIAVDRLLQHIRDHDDVDVYSTILDMRNYRCNMVQTEDQFVYIYECIKDFITTDEEEDQEEEDSDHLYENTGFHGNIYENTAFQKE